MIDFLEHLRNMKHPVKDVQKVDKPQKFRLRRSHTLDMQAYVIFLRYGSLTEPNKVQHTFKRIKDITGVKAPTAYKMIKRWKSNGFKFIKAKKIIPESKWARPEVIKFIMNPKTLLE